MRKYIMFYFLLLVVIVNVSCSLFKKTPDKIKYKNNIVSNNQFLLSFIVSEPETIDTSDLPNCNLGHSISNYAKMRYCNYTFKKHLVKVNIYIINNLALPNVAQGVLDEQLVFNDSLTNSLWGSKLDTNRLIPFPYNNSILTCYFITQNHSEIKKLKEYYAKGKLLFFTKEYLTNKEVFSSVYYPFNTRFFNTLIEVKRYERINIK